mgnify:CR=1 FL=1
MPAVVLLDLKPPKRNGIEILIEIWQDKTLHSLPVVMLTSSREEPDIVRCYEIGVIISLTNWMITEGTKVLPLLPADIRLSVKLLPVCLF